MRQPLIEKIVQELIADHHAHLERAKIVVLGKPKAGKRGDKQVLVEGKKPSKALKALWKEGVGEELHYVIVVGRVEWDKLDKAERKRIELDKVLTKFVGLDEKGHWAIRTDSDIEIDLPILRRYGPITAELEILAKDPKQQGLFERKAGA